MGWWGYMYDNYRWFARLDDGLDYLVWAGHKYLFFPGLFLLGWSCAAWVYLY